MTSPLDSPLEREMTESARLRVAVSRLEADNARLRVRLEEAESELGTARARLQDIQLRSGLDCCREAMLAALRRHFQVAHPGGFVANGALPPESAQMPS